MPELLLQRPTTTAELADLIRAATAANTQIQLTGSNSLPLTRFNPTKPRQQISTLRLNKILEHAVPDMTVIVHAGISLETLQRQLAWQNQWLPVDPPSYKNIPPANRTLGGLIATNSLGPLRFSTGDWRLLIMGITWIDASGNIIKGGGRTVKNVAGYSSPRLLIGSAGSLGAIAEITLRTAPRPADEQSLILFAESPQSAEKLLAQILLAPINPAYIQAVGGRTFSANPLALPTMKRGLAIIVGFLDRPQSCAAQIQTLRQLPAAQPLESIAQTAAQSGRLRLWLTSEAALPTISNSLGARIHTLSSNVCEIIAALEAAAKSAGPPHSAWVVSEAATGIIRTVLTLPNPAALLQQISAQHHATLLSTQGDPLPTAPNNLADRLKQQLDPTHTFGIITPPTEPPA